MWRCFVRDQARVPSVAGAGSSLFRNRNNFFSICITRAPRHASPLRSTVVIDTYVTWSPPPSRYVHRAPLQQHIEPPAARPASARAHLADTRGDPPPSLPSRCESCSSAVP